MKKLLLFIGISLLLAGTLFAQSDSTKKSILSIRQPLRSSVNNSFTKTTPFRVEKPGYDLEKILEKISVNGYYRFYGWQRNLRDPWSVLPENQFANTPPYVIGVGDVYRDPPLLLMVIGARPSSKTYIGMDVALYSNFTGNPGASVTNLNLGINLNGSISTDIGKFGFQMGGINWVEMSDLVFSGFIGYERFSLFTRNPWEGALSTTERAQFFHEQGTISRDLRFGQQAFKGVLFDGYQLPGNTSFRVMFGTTPVTANLETNIPNYTYGGQFKWSPKKLGTFSYNTITYVNFVDSLATQRDGLGLHTIGYDHNFKDINIHIEGGRAFVFNDANGQRKGDGIRAKLKLPARITGIPVEVEYFNLAPEFINYYGSFLSQNNVSFDTDNQAISTGGGAVAFAGSITDVGQISNNRSGGSINTWIDLGSTKINLGLMTATEKNSVSNTISWGHKINALPFSRFITFTNNVGPYDRWTSFFRGFAQETQIIDLAQDGLPKTRITYNTAQVHVKQAFNALKRKGFLFYVGTFGSANASFSPIPRLTDNSYLVTQYHEFDLHYNLNKTFDFVATAGYEFVNGNYQTARGDNVNGILGDMANDPVNQKSTLYGLGLDVDISDQAGLYIRRRWFTQKDESFVLDDIKGTDTTIEFKIFF